MFCKINDGPCYGCNIYCTEAWQKVEKQVAKELAAWKDESKALKAFGLMF